jgi:hypothetical protein
MTALRAFRKGVLAVSLEIQAFRIHLDGITAHDARKKLQEEAKYNVLSQRYQWVRSQVDVWKMGVLLEHE